MSESKLVLLQVHCAKKYMYAGGNRYLNIILIIWLNSKTKWTHIILSDQMCCSWTTKQQSCSKYLYTWRDFISILFLCRRCKWSWCENQEGVMLYSKGKHHLYMLSVPFLNCSNNVEIKSWHSLLRTDDRKASPDSRCWRIWKI